jgi:hypothetical protein
MHELQYVEADGAIGWITVEAADKGEAITIAHDYLDADGIAVRSIYFVSK